MTSDLATDPTECNVCAELQDSAFDRYIHSAVKHAELSPSYVKEQYVKNWTEPVKISHVCSISSSVRRLKSPGIADYYNRKSEFALSFLKAVTEELLPRVSHNRNRIINWNNVHAWTGIVKGVEVRVNIHLVVDSE